MRASIFELARYMGTSVEMIDRTYGHLAKGAEGLGTDEARRLRETFRPRAGHGERAVTAAETETARQQGFP
ncbi:MAG: hypothetical protein ABIP53_03680 [Candidatus Limnocylindrales bacterium]